MKTKSPSELLTPAMTCHVTHCSPHITTRGIVCNITINISSHVSHSWDIFATHGRHCITVCLPAWSVEEAHNVYHNYSAEMSVGSLGLLLWHSRYKTVLGLKLPTDQPALEATLHCQYTGVVHRLGMANALFRWRFLWDQQCYYWDR